MKKVKKYIWIFLASLLFFFVVGVPLRGFVGAVYGTMIETICYAFITYFFLQKKAKKKEDIYMISGLIILGRIILELPLRISDFEGTLISLPNTLLACLAVVLATFVFMTKKKMIIGIASIIIWSYCVFIGHEKWLDYIIWGPVPEVNVSSFVIKTSEGDKVLEDIKDSYILLDFWNSKCGVCFQSFPHLQTIYDTYRDKISLASVFVPLYKGEQQEDGQSRIDKMNYTFPVWSVAQKDTLLNILRIDGYPTVILLDEKRNVLFKGNLKNAQKKLEDLIN